ncbi:MAG: hypothetical protein IJN54_07325 [Lachnospiraceae bacterium]|nr:hypothetical protein [Lachnospiraceae bacterium]
MIEQEVKRWICELCDAAGEKALFAENFINRLEQAPEIYKELLYFAYHQNFLCQYKIQGYSIVDIMVWQMDHFKAQLDRDNYTVKHNQNKMVLTAFDTFLKMEKEPQKYVELLQSETGTDYPGKY